VTPTVTLINAIANAKSESYDVVQSMTASTDLPTLSIASWSARSATDTASRTGDMPGTRRTTITQRALSQT
jgi:hypothetical protein